MENVLYPLNQPIDQSSFQRVQKVVAVRVAAKDVSTTMGTLKTILYPKKGKKSVYQDPIDEDYRVVALDDTLTRTEIEAKLAELTPGKTWVFAEAEIEFSYKDYNYHEVLKQLLPADITTPSGFETIGHIAHLNLKEPQYPWKYLIGTLGLLTARPSHLGKDQRYQDCRQQDGQAEQRVQDAGTGADRRCKELRSGGVGREDIDPRRLREDLLVLTAAG